MKKMPGKMPKIEAGNGIVPGTMMRAMNWEELPAGANRPTSLPKEFIMRNKILAIAAIAAAVSAPIAARAQSDTTVGVARGAPVAVESEGIAVDRRPAFRQYVIRERVPDHTIPDRVVIGGVLPEVGVTYYDVPQEFGVTPYHYTIVNGQTILVEPRTRRIVQVIN